LAHRKDTPRRAGQNREYQPTDQQSKANLQLFVCVRCLTERSKRNENDMHTDRRARLVSWILPQSEASYATGGTGTSCMDDEKKKEFGENIRRRSER